MIRLAVVVIIVTVIIVSAAVTLATLLAQAAGHVELTGMVLLLMIGLAMYFGRLIANWAGRK